jgi:hypothetical protein
MTIRLRAGTVDITMRYTLDPRDESARVERRVTIDAPWSLRPFQPAIVHAFRVESGRTLIALKAYCDALGAT